MIDRLRMDLLDLMCVPGLSGYETRVRQAIRGRVPDGILGTTDALGNLIVTFEGTGPSVMLFTHMDQLGFFVRRIEDNGLIRVERMGGVPESALAAQPVVLCPPGRPDVPGIITNKSHHATTPDEKYVIVKAPDLTIDTGHGSRAQVEAAGICIGTPVVYQPRAKLLGETRVTGTAVDDRAGCAMLLEVARQLANRTKGPTVHLVFSVQEEFNLRGAVVAAQVLQRAGDAAAAGSSGRIEPHHIRVAVRHDEDLNRLVGEAALEEVSRSPPREARPHAKVLSDCW